MKQPLEMTDQELQDILYSSSRTSDLDDAIMEIAKRKCSDPKDPYAYALGVAIAVISYQNRELRYASKSKKA